MRQHLLGLKERLERILGRGSVVIVISDGDARIIMCLVEEALMAKNWILSRDEAEYLVVLLEEQPMDEIPSRLAEELRTIFGMVTKDEEIAYRREHMTEEQRLADFERRATAYFNTNAAEPKILIDELLREVNSLRVENEKLRQK